MKKVCLGILCTLFWANCFLSIVSAGESGKIDNRVNAAATELLGDYGVPGAAITVLDGEKVYTYTYGFMDREKQIPMKTDTIFEAASLSKLFTALLCADEITQKEMRLSDPLTKYIPGLPKNNAAISKVTLLQSLTHTSGFPLNLPDEISSREQVLRYLDDWNPQSPIGSHSQYSNVGIGLAAIAAEYKENQSIDDLVKERILKPLEMEPIGMTVEQSRQKNYAQGYTAEGTPTAQFADQTAPFPGAYSLRVTIRDMEKFLMAAAGTKNTPKKLRQAMKLTQIPRVDIGRMQQGMAWQIHSLKNNHLQPEPENLDLNPLPAQWLPEKDQTFHADRLMDKTGGTNGFRSYIAVIPEKKIGVVILLNKHISNGAIVNIGRSIIGVSTSK